MMDQITLPHIRIPRFLKRCYISDMPPPEAAISVIVN
jgi:hypothetical protein